MTKLVYSSVQNPTREAYYHEKSLTQKHADMRRVMAAKLATRQFRTFKQEFLSPLFGRVLALHKRGREWQAASVKP